MHNLKKNRVNSFFLNLIFECPRTSVGAQLKSLGTSEFQKNKTTQLYFGTKQKYVSSLVQPNFPCLFYFLRRFFFGVNFLSSTARALKARNPFEIFHSKPENKFTGILYARVGAAIYSLDFSAYIWVGMDSFTLLLLDN